MSDFSFFPRKGFYGNNFLSYYYIARTILFFTFSSKISADLYKQILAWLETGWTGAGNPQ
jgi:hypothetical protein